MVDVINAICGISKNNYRNGNNSVPKTRNNVRTFYSNSNTENDQRDPFKHTRCRYDLSEALRKITGQRFRQVNPNNEQNTYPLENGLEISIDIEAGVPTERLVLQVAGTVSYNSGNISCNGNNDGFASVLPPTQDQWLVVWKDLDGNVLKQEATTGVSNISNLSAGEYLIEMTNGNWGTKVAQFEITEPDALNLVVNTEDESCFGYNNGKIAVTMFGGTGNINWYINNELQTHTTASRQEHEHIKLIMCIHEQSYFLLHKR